MWWNGRGEAYPHLSLFPLALPPSHTLQTVQVYVTRCKQLLAAFQLCSPHSSCYLKALFSIVVVSCSLPFSLPPSLSLSPLLSPSVSLSLRLSLCCFLLFLPSSHFTPLLTQLLWSSSSPVYTSPVLLDNRRLLAFMLIALIKQPQLGLRVTVQYPEGQHLVPTTRPQYKSCHCGA